MKVLIVGGGIGGLALAGFLKQKSIDCVVIEKCKQWRTIGYILALAPVAVKQINALGASAVLANSAKVQGHIIKNASDKVILEKSFDVYEKKYGPTCEVEREELHKTLREVNKDTEIRMNTTIAALDETSEGVNVTFSDGKKEQFDIVVGADGINSQLRSMIQPKATTDYSGATFWFMWVPKVTKIESIVNYIGEGQLVGLYPCKKRDKMCVLFMVPRKQHSITDPKESIPFLKSHFRNMKGHVPTVLEHLPAEPDAMYHHDDDEVHLRNWYKGRIVLLGDAVHALSPVFGLGAAMALEDAAVLSEELARCDNHTAAFENYKQRRFPRVHKIATMSREVHALFRLYEVPLLKKLLYKCTIPFASRFFKKYYKNVNTFFQDDI